MTLHGRALEFYYIDFLKRHIFGFRPEAAIIGQNHNYIGFWAEGPQLVIVIVIVIGVHVMAWNC